MKAELTKGGPEMRRRFFLKVQSLTVPLALIFHKVLRKAADNRFLRRCINATGRVLRPLGDWYRKHSRRIFLVILVGGLALVIYAASGIAYAFISQARLEKQFEAALEVPASVQPEPMPLPQELKEASGAKLEYPKLDPLPKQGEPLFRMQIPKIKLDNIVLYGNEDATLNKAPGVTEETSLPWLGNNTSIGGHRDTFFYRFGELTLGDEVRVILKDKRVLKYKISNIAIVEPENVKEMDPTSTPTLTLITCWPLRFIGPAPLRLIIQAEIVPNLND